MDYRKLEQSTMSRRALPDRRRSWTQKLKVGGQTAYVSFGEYEDGTLGEVWIEVAKAGTAARGLVSAVAVFASVSLQYGMPVAAIVDNFKCMSFEPCGKVENMPEQPYARSLLEVVGRLIEAEYPDGKRRQSISSKEQDDNDNSTDADRATSRDRGHDDQPIPYKPVPYPSHTGGGW